MSQNSQHRSPLPVNSSMIFLVTSRIFLSMFPSGGKEGGGDLLDLFLPESSSPLRSGLCFNNKDKSDVM
ncbi:unnamed protein product [Staurois parvus]|uniref:Uncharacterized protein n=1 Tax=Staurois parvus TaxID=386267 RepID=A0ABN9DWW5_9NEOB|nr:unnamed protein product [Staurois parvus]